MEYIDKLPPDNRDLSMFPGQYGWPFLGKTVELVKDTLAMCNKHYDKYGPVSRLDMVKKGDVIGLVGNTGISSGPHLHFEIWKGGRSIDPLIYFPELIKKDLTLKK